MSAVVTVRAVVGPGTEELIPTTIPAQLRSSLIDWLNASHVNLRHSPGEEVKFKCENNITAEFEQEFPDLRLRWLLDGGPVCLQPSRMLIHSHTLTMNSLNIRDSGLYECRMEFSGKSVPADFFALHVPADFPTLRPRETEPLTLDCNSQALVRVLRNTDYSATVTAAGGGKQAQKTTVNESEAIFRRWFHNGSVTPLLPDTISVAEPSPDTVSSASTRNLSGEWECVVTHVPTNRSWTTRWYRVFVRDPPSDLELWWRAVLAYPWVVSAVGLALVFGFIGLSILIAKKAQKKNINLEEQYQRLKQRIASRHTRTGRRISSVLRGDAEPPKIVSIT
nr:hypothetical protein BaRGS_031976 [Batillaria attramentaria]